ncbi:MAG TPA: hypothetical protein VFE65_28325 [Pseudonocardia sp.]|nr:hypothetical protein [Pseudonocardia sp.]
MDAARLGPPATRPNQPFSHTSPQMLPGQVVALERHAVEQLDEDVDSGGASSQGVLVEQAVIGAVILGKRGEQGATNVTSLA